MVDAELKAARERIAELERALSTLGGMWQQGRPKRATGIEFRRVYNDVNCSPWTKIPDLFSNLFADLHEYLSYQYGEDPKLEITGFDHAFYQDKYDLQYRGVVECDKCEGIGWVMSSYQATGASNFERCPGCLNPSGHDHP